PGNGDALALATRELDPALAHVGIEARAPLGVGQLWNELVGPGPAYRFPDLCLAGVRPAVQQVVADRAVQQRGVLGDHADLRAQAGLVDLGDVLAVDENTPAFHVVQAQQQVDQGRLAGPGGAYQADLLARADIQVQPVDDLAAL